MDQKRYPDEKWKRLSSQGQTKLLAFWKKIPRAQLLKATAHIKIEGGFRGEQLIAKQAAFVCSNVLGPIPKRRLSARAALSGTWFNWVNAQPNLYNLLIKYDNSADFSPAEVPPNSELDLGCFKYLLQHAETQKISRQTVRDFYDFGYFLPDQQIESLIAQFPESFVEPISATPVEEPAEREDSEVRESDSFRALKENVRVMRTELQDLKEATKNIGVSLDIEKGRIKRAENLIESSKEMIRDAEGEFELQRENMAAKIETVNERLGKLDEAAVGFEKRISSLEKRTSDLGAKVQSGLSSVATTAEAPSMLQPKVDQIAASQVVRNATNIDQIFEILSGNLHACGLNAQGSNLVATDVLTAMIAGQVPVFCGSYADDVAFAAAASLSDSQIQSIEIPLGLSNGDAFSNVLDSFLRKRNCGSLIIRGLNRAPIEIYATSVMKLATRFARGGECSFPKGIFGVLTPMPGGLPLYAALSELGPIINLDALTWTPQNSSKDFSFAQTGNGLDSIPQNLLNDSAIHLEEQIDECRKMFDPNSSIAWKDILRLAWGIQQKLPFGDREQQLLGFVCCWLIPRGQCFGISPSEILIHIRELFGEQFAGHTRLRKTVALNAERWL